jgi:tRNA (guanine-N7-)-methyltransferase
MSDRADRDAPEYMRRIRSFVLREGRMTPPSSARSKHWAAFRHRLLGTVPQDFHANFGRAAPLVLEIGFGNGEALAWASEHDLRATSSALKSTVPASAA